MNFSVSSGGVAGVNAYTGYKNNTFNNNFINQEYDFGDDPNYYNEVASNSIVFSEYDEGALILAAMKDYSSDLGNIVFASKEYSSYFKNAFYIALKDPLLYGGTIVDSISKKIGGKAGVAAAVRAGWVVLSILGGKEVKWQDVINEIGVSAYGKTKFNDFFKKGIESRINRYVSSLYQTIVKHFPNLSLTEFDVLEDMPMDDPGFETLFNKYEVLENNLYRSGNIFDDLYTSGGYLKSGAAGSFSGSMSKIGEYMSNSAPDFAKYAASASSAMLGKIGAATGTDYVASLAVNLVKGIVNWNPNDDFLSNIGRVLSISSMKYGSTLLSSSWKAIGGVAGESIGFAIAGPAGAKVGKLVGTLVGAEIGTFVVELFDGKEGWCAAAGVAAIGGAVAGGAIATALVVGAEVSLAFPVGTIIGVAIIAGAIVATAVVWLGYLIFG